MPEKRKRGGQKNNLNAVKWPWGVFWKRQALREVDDWLPPHNAAYLKRLRQDNPGASEAALRMMEIAATACGATMLILKEAARNGFIVKQGGSWDLSPGAKDLPKFLAIERQALQTLGLERKTKAPIMLADYLETKKQTEEPQL